MNNMNTVELYVHGLSLWNNVGGYAAILIYGERRKELAGGFQSTTSNRMTLIAVIEGLKALKAKCHVVIRSQNLYLIESMAKGWVQRWRDNGWTNSERNPTPNVDLWTQLLTLGEQHELDFVWLERGEAAPEHKRCELLARQAAKRNDLPLDAGVKDGQT